MRILIPLYVVLGLSWSRADEPESCQILQTTDARTPCYIFIRDRSNRLPTFVYMLNLPRPTPETPCPVFQSLNPAYNCYLPPKSTDYPAFILNVPLPPNADDLDESSSGKAKLRENKLNPIFQKTGGVSARQAVFPGQPSAVLGPPSPLVTMAYFKPLSPSKNERTVQNVFLADHSSSPLNVYRQPQYHITRYQTAVDQPSYTRFTHSTQRGSFPYPSSGGGGSINVFEAPYPAAL